MLLHLMNMKGEAVCIIKYFCQPAQSIMLPGILCSQKDITRLFAGASYSVDAHKKRPVTGSLFDLYIAAAVHHPYKKYQQF